MLLAHGEAPRHCDDATVACGMQRSGTGYCCSNSLSSSSVSGRVVPSSKTCRNATRHAATPAQKGAAHCIRQDSTPGCGMAQYAARLRNTCSVAQRVPAQLGSGRAQRLTCSRCRSTQQQQVPAGCGHPPIQSRMERKVRPRLYAWSGGCEARRERREGRLLVATWLCFD